MTAGDPPAFDSAAAGRRVIATEVEALNTLAASLDGAFSRAVEVLFTLKGRIVLTGVGKSGHVARKIAATLASTGSPSMFVHPTEASHGDLGMITPDDALIALSKSGEAKELADILAYCKRFGAPIIAMTAQTDSALGRIADIVLLLPDAPEAAEGVAAPTTSTTLQMALGDALAVTLIERRGFTAHDFKIFHPGGKLGSVLRTVGDLMHGPEELPLCAGDTPVSEALLIMTNKRFGCVGVLDADERLLGVVTDGDLRRHMDGLLERRAAEVMTAGPKTVTPGLLAGEALRLMNDSRITVLFVVEDGRPVGILHVHDILRAGVL